MEVWADQYRGDANMCWARVMEYWLNGSSEGSDYPVTWEGLYLLLNDAEFSEVAEELKMAVDGVSVSSSNTLTDGKDDISTDDSVKIPIGDVDDDDDSTSADGDCTTAPSDNLSTENKADEFCKLTFALVAFNCRACMATLSLHYFIMITTALS